ncbi:MAG: hypothetical protein AB1591_12765 [Pseudomonadota bacterium]
MAELREELKKLEDAVIQQRDELRVKMHLAKADARDEWEKLESKWAEVQTKFAEVKKAASESSGNIEAAARLLADELLKGYERIRKLI